MPVFPYEAKRVVADFFDVLKHKAPSCVKANGPMMPLAHSARTKTPQHFMRIDALVPVSPIDFERVGISRRAKLDGLGTRT